MRLPATTALTGLLVLAACGSEPAPVPAPNAATSAVQTGKGNGTVTAVDKAAGSVTLDHGPIAEIGWPAMTMTFRASPALLEGVAAGDKVAFELTVKDGANEVTSIAKN